MSSRLPQPTGRQKEVLYLPAHGHVVVLGTAGSGKTTLAIHRALHLADPATDHCGRTLLVTFNRCLVTYMKALADGIPSNVDVLNYHKFARGYLNVRGRMRKNCICSPDEERLFCEMAMKGAIAAGSKDPVLKRPVEFMVEEFHWLAQHGIRTMEEYVAAERVGGAGRRIGRANRAAVFNAYERYKALRTANGKDYDWEDLSHAVLEEFEKDTGGRYYRHVVLDEGQDLSPMMLRSLAAAIPQEGSLTFFGDMAQQIYGSKMSWRSAGLRLGGREVWRFEENYRNTKQIAQLALAIAKTPHFHDIPDLVAPKSPTADGPPPALVSFSDENKEMDFVARIAARRAGTVAILLRNRDEEETLRQRLQGEATRLHRDLASWPEGPGIFYGTYHAAKGLEFDTVILPQVSEARVPLPEEVDIFGRDEAAAQDSRLLYVGVTRARATLIMTYTGQVTSLLPADRGLYQETKG